MANLCESDCTCSKCQSEPDDSNAGSLVLRVAAMETRVEDDGDRIEHLENLLQTATNRLEKEMAALERLEASIKTTERNHWRREFVKVVLPYAYEYAHAPARIGDGINYASVAVGMADQLLAALEAREKEDEK